MFDCKAMPEIDFTIVQVCSAVYCYLCDGLLNACVYLQELKKVCKDLEDESIEVHFVHVQVSDVIGVEFCLHHTLRVRVQSTAGKWIMIGY